MAFLRQSVQTAEDRGEPYARAVLAAAAALQAHEYSLFTCARDLGASAAVDPAEFAATAVGFITYHWRAALAGTVLLPPSDPALDTDRSNRLRALIGRVLADS